MRKAELRRAAILLAACQLAIAKSATADQFTISFGLTPGGTPDLAIGGNQNTTHVQGFSPSVAPNPNPGLSASDTVTLSQFSFFKSGNVDAAENIRLAILNNIFPTNPVVTQTTTASPTFIGLSTNTIANTTGIATNDPISFSFDNLPLTYGSNYAAVLVNVGEDTGGGAPLTPVLVSALVVNYALNPNDNQFHPVANYGAENQFQYATSNFIQPNGFFNTFSFAGDADFRAVMDFTPVVSGSTWTGALFPDATWSGGGGGNWNPVGAPNAPDTTANFGPNANNSYSVLLDPGGDTVGNINFTGSVSYTIGTTAGPALTLQLTAGQPVISDNSGDHTIAAPLNLPNNTTITALAGTTLTLASELVTVNSLTVTKTGAGTLKVERVASGTLSIANAGGTVSVSEKLSPNSAAGTSVLTNLFVEVGGAMDLTNNALILTSSPAGGTATENIIRQMFQSGRIITSLTAGGHAVGYADNFALGATLFGGQNVDSSVILIGYTFSGDTNLDGKVNSLDFNALTTNFGLETGAFWMTGDFNYDGAVNTDDFTVLSQNFNLAMASPAASLGTLVPEPALGVVAVTTMLLYGRRRRGRS